MLWFAAVFDDWRCVLMRFAWDLLILFNIVGLVRFVVGGL